MARSAMDELFERQPGPMWGVSDLARDITNTKDYSYIDDMLATVGSQKTQSSGDPWWLSGLQTVANSDTMAKLASSGKLLTNQLANWTDGSLNWKDIPFADSAASVLKKHLTNLRDVNLQGLTPWGIVDSTLSTIGREGKDTKQSLVNLGANPDGHIANWGGFAGDMILDPLNFMTFGGASAIKAGKAAMTATAKQLGEEALTEAGKKVIDDAGRATRNQAQNSLINFDVPFTNITKQFGEKPEWLKIKDATVGFHGSRSIDNMLRSVGIDHPDDQAKFLQSVFGVSKADDLTSQGLDFLRDNLDKIQKPHADGPNIIRDTSQLFAPSGPKALEGRADDLANALPLGDTARALPGQPSLTDVMAEVIMGGASKRAGKASNVVDADLVGHLDGAIDDIGKFVQDMGGVSKLGSKIRNPFNARTFGSADNFVNQGASKLRDAEAKIFGRTKQMERTMQGIAKIGKGLTKEEWNDIPHIIEGTKEASKNPKVMEVVEAMKAELGKIGKNDVNAGIVKDLLENYFPHVIKPNADELLKKYKDDPKLKTLLGKSATHGHGNERKGFENFKELDDYVKALEIDANKARMAGDDATAASLMKKAEDISNFFERDPMKAVGQRAYKSIRAQAMKELFDGYKADGFLAIGKSDEATVRASEGLKHLSDSEIKALGLKVRDGEKAFMHPEILEGMKKVNGLLTSKGAQKALDGFTAFTNVWKTLVTSYVPAHYMNNLIGNIANNAMVGVRPKDYTNAGKLLLGMKSGKLTPEQEKLIQAAYDRGVLGQGYSSEFVKSPITGDKSKFMKAFQDNAYARTLRKGGDLADDFSRLALFLKGVDSTGSTAKAGDMVRKYLFSYNEMTTGDKMMRVAMPFWNWTKRNLPLQLENLLTQPRYAMTYMKIKEQLQGEIDKDSMPQWMRDAYIRVPGTDKFINPRLPISDLNVLGGPTHTLTQIMSMMNPVAKSLAEVPLNKQFFNNKPIDYDRDRNGGYDPAKIGDYALRQTGVIDKAANIFSGENGFDLNSLGAFLGIPKSYEVR